MDDSAQKRQKVSADAGPLRRRTAEVERKKSGPQTGGRASGGDEQLYRTLFQSSKDGLVIVSGDSGAVIDANQSFLEMTGYSPGRILGHKVQELPSFRRTDAVLVMFSKLQTGDSIYYDDLPLEHANGNSLSVEIIGAAHFIGGRKILQYTIRDIGVRKAATEELWKAESRFRSLFRKAAFGIVMAHTDGTVIEINPAMEKMLGYREKEMIGRNFSDLVYNEDRGADADLFQKLLTRGEEGCQLAMRCLRKNGNVVWGLHALSLIRDGKNEPLYVIRMIEDITDRKRAEETVLKSRDFYLSLINELPNPIRRSDALGQGDYFNRAWLEFRGRTLSDEIGDSWTHAVHPEDRARFMGILSGAQRNHNPYMTEYRLQNRNGEYRWMVESGSPFNDFDGNFSGYISSCYDVQDRKNIEEALHSLSTTDELTGLLNRRGFFALAKQQIKVANRTGKGFLLLFVDVDGMKKINDRLGHPEGDHALVETAYILHDISRKSDIVGRLGGDEFAVLALEEQGCGDREQAILKRIRESIRAKNSTPNRLFTLAISAGIVRYDPAKPCSLDELISRADALMYEEKKSKPAQDLSRD